MDSWLTHTLTAIGAFLSAFVPSFLKLRQQSAELKAFQGLWAEAGVARAVLTTRCDVLEKRVETCETDRAGLAVRVAILETRLEDRLTRHPDRDLPQSEEDE